MSAVLLPVAHVHRYCMRDGMEAHYAGTCNAAGLCTYTEPCMGS